MSFKSDIIILCYISMALGIGGCAVTKNITYFELAVIGMIILFGIAIFDISKQMVDDPYETPRDHETQLAVRNTKWAEENLH